MVSYICCNRCNIFRGVVIVIMVFDYIISVIDKFFNFFNFFFKFSDVEVNSVVFFGIVVMCISREGNSFEMVKLLCVFVDGF